jgi:tetratricopeptide (TPR) repeat protein
LDSALHYAERFLSLEAGSNIKGWLLLARILSAQKQFLDAESIVDSALDRTGMWDQGVLLRTKAKLQIAQGKVPSAIETYIRLLAIFLVQRKTFGSRTKLYKVHSLLCLVIYNSKSYAFIFLLLSGIIGCCLP